MQLHQLAVSALGDAVGGELGWRWRHRRLPIDADLGEGRAIAPGPRFAARWWNYTMRNWPDTALVVSMVTLPWVCGEDPILVAPSRSAVAEIEVETPAGVGSTGTTFLGVTTCPRVEQHAHSPAESAEVGSPDSPGQCQ